MEPCGIDARGVNSHDLDWKNRIEAEEFFSLRAGRKVDLLDAGGGDGFAVGAGHGALLRYPHVRHLRGELALRVAATAAGRGALRPHAPRGPAAGQTQVHLDHHHHPYRLGLQPPR